MNNSLSDMFSTSDIFDLSNVTINNSFENLRIIFEDVLCTVSFVDVEENVFKEEIPKLKQACIDATNQIHEHLKNSNNVCLEDIKQLLQRYNRLLDFALTAIKYITSKISYSQIPSLPLVVSEIIVDTFKHCKESDVIYGNHFVSVSYLLTDLFKKTNELQNSFLTLLNNLLIYNVSQEEDIVFLVKVSNNLVKIGEIVSGLDIKTAAELWKGYLMLLQKYNQDIKTRIDISVPIKYFCIEITNSLESINSMPDMKHMEKTLKITSFNLKIIIKLCNLYECNGESIEDIFNLLITLNKFSIPYLQYHNRNTKYIDLLQTYVIVAFEPLLNCFLGSREFVQFYFRHIQQLFKDDITTLSAVFLTISILKKNIDTDPNVKKLWISFESTNNIIFTTISSLDLFYSEFSLNYEINFQANGFVKKLSLYELILIYLTTVIITLDANHIENVQKILFTSILKTDLWKSMLCADIWIILGRYSSSEFCYESLKFLIDIFLKLQNCNRVEIKNLNSLISRNYVILSNNYKNVLFNQYPVNKYIKLWTVIGIENESKLKQDLNNVITQIDTFCNQRSVGTFKPMNDVLELLPSDIFTIEQNQINNFINRIIKLWTLNIDHQLCEQTWYVKFINNLSKITTIIIKYINNENLVKILQNVKSSNHENIKLIQCAILKSLASKQISASQDRREIFNLISILFNNLLKDKNPVVKQTNLEAFNYFTHHTIHEEILSDIVEENSTLQEEISNYLQKIVPEMKSTKLDYLNCQKHVIIKHKCPEKIKLIEPVPKKKKIDNNLPAVVNNIKNNCDQILDFYKNEKISEDILNELNTISFRIESLLNIK